MKNPLRSTGVAKLLALTLGLTAYAGAQGSTPPEFLSIAGPSTAPVLMWSSLPGTIKYGLQVSTDPSFTQLILDDSAVYNTLKIIGNLDSTVATGYYCRVAALPSSGMTDWSGALKFFAEAGHDVFGLPEPKGWNLLSMPLVVSDTARNFIFPARAGCTMPSTYCYDGGYVCCGPYLRPQSYGFWNRAPENRLLAITGIPLIGDTQNIAANWNLIGPGFSGSAVSDITTDPPGLIYGTFFSYASPGYVAADSLLPFKGYWVRSGGPGRIIFPGRPDVPGHILVYIHWDDQPVGKKKVVLVETKDTLYTDASGVVKISLPAGKYTVRAFEIERGGPTMLTVDFEVKVYPAGTTIVDVIDCLPCL